MLGGSHTVVGDKLPGKIKCQRNQTCVVVLTMLSTTRCQHPNETHARRAPRGAALRASGHVAVAVFWFGLQFYSRVRICAFPAASRVEATARVSLLSLLWHSPLCSQSGSRSALTNVPQAQYHTKEAEGSFSFIHFFGVIVAKSNPPRPQRYDQVMMRRCRPRGRCPPAARPG